MMKVFSDLHLEFGTPFAAKAAIVVLGGDIATKPEQLSLANIEADLVVGVIGNHEYYAGVDINEWREAWDKKGWKLLENDTLEFNSIKFAGTTLWCDPTVQAWKSMNDSRVLSLDAAFQMHLQAKEFLAHNRDADVVITHHIPSWNLVSKEFIGHPANSAFVGNVEEEIMHHKVWCYGHTHTPLETTIGDCKIICNPRGYPNENNY